jgi:hypothetical protein
MNFGTLSSNPFQALSDSTPDQDEDERFADHEASDGSPSLASGSSNGSGTRRPRWKKVKKRK